MHTATVAVPLPDPHTADAILQALQPEASEGPEGTDTTLRQDGATLHIDVTAADLSGLRAALNSAVRLLDAARRTLQAGDQEP